MELETPRKAALNAIRLDNIEKARSELSTVLKDVVPDTEKIYRLYAKTISIDDDIINKTVVWCKENKILYIQAPFEADPILFALEEMLVTDGTITEDTDLLFLGCKLVVTDTVYSKHNECNCNISKKDEVIVILQSKFDVVNEPSFEELAMYGTILGSDYFKFEVNHNCGKVTANKIMGKYFKSNDRNFDSLIMVIKSFLSDWGSLLDIQNFKLGINLLLYGIVWDIQSLNTATTINF